ncbi:MAG: PIN domain-containing protein [Myxococcales bacterium]|nr:PIN domain-containing protein [Myxococcales bacterium]
MSLFDEVEASRPRFVITKRGRPVARVVPLPREPSSSLRARLLHEEDLLARPYTLWLEAALCEDRRTELLPLLPQIAVGAVQLSWSHADPADRLIVATARVNKAALVTADERIRESGVVRTVWD